MPQPDPAALAFLRARRSHPARLLQGPAPTAEELRPLLEAAARSPDHGKLVPWRFVVLSRPALDRLAALVELRGPALGIAPDKIAKARAQYADSPLAVAVVQCPRTTEKVPLIEQTYAVGGVCLALLNAAHAAGWGANWLTGWPAYDAECLAQGFGLQPDEGLAGVIHIGRITESGPDRPRPDLDAITTWA